MNNNKEKKIFKNLFTVWLQMRLGVDNKQIFSLSSYLLVSILLFFGFIILLNETYNN